MRSRGLRLTVANLRRGRRPDHRRGQTERAGSLPAARQGTTDERDRMVDVCGIGQLHPCQWPRLVPRDDRVHSVRLRREMDNVVDFDRHRNTAKERFSMRQSTLE